MKLAEDYLPRTARELVELIGLPATVRLVEGYAGRTLQIPKGKRARGKVLLQALADAIGATATDQIAQRYGGDFLAVPNCKRALLASRDGELQARFDTLTKQGGHSARKAVAILVGEYGLVESSVWRALKRPAAEVAVAKAVVDTGQADLFAA